jgi:predicted NBD/HSP70 family sugar kinase
MVDPKLRRQRGSRADRVTNTQEVLSLLRASGPSSQADIARATTLARATVNHIVRALRDQGAVEYQWKNRREALVALLSTHGSVASIIVRERFVHAILFDFTGQQRFDLYSSDLPEYRESRTSPAMVLDIAARLHQGAQRRNSRLMGISIAMEGPIENGSGAIAPWAWQRLPNWKQVDIQQHFSRHLHVPVVVDNDANLAALAEWTWGVGRGSQDFLYITCSEGIGGGIVINGRVYRGGTGLAGEIGHMVIEEAGDLCFCGSRGCLTSFSSERAILKALQESGASKASLREVIEGARHGDAACQRVLSDAGAHLGKALATVVRVMGPSVIAVGGVLGSAGDIILEGLRSSAEVMNLRKIGEAPEFRVASIMEHATELGGVAAILSELRLGMSSLTSWMLSPLPSTALNNSAKAVEAVADG